MGNCSSDTTDGGLIPHRDIEQAQPPQIQVTDSAMGDRSDFNNFLEANNCMVKMAKDKYDQYDDLKRQNRDLKRKNEEIMAQHETLRQRISNDSEMSHRSHQSSSEDVTSRNKRSDVLQKCKRMDGAIRRHAMEVFGKHSDRALNWYRKDLTCRIFMIAYKLAKRTKEEFIQQALPRFFQSAPSVGVHFEESPQQARRFCEQQISEEMQHLLSTTESFTVACSSVLKELAVSCDLTDLEQKLVTELKKCRDSWQRPYPWLPYLEDSIMRNEKMQSFIKDCLRLAWRMVNLLPPLKIVTVDEVDVGKWDEYFEKEVEENKESTKTMNVCVWPAVMECYNDEVLQKGGLAIIPKPKNVACQV